MTEDEEREAIVAEARSWVGTPYHANADIKGAGVDCGMLLVRVFVDSGLVTPFDPRPYPPQWPLHQRAERYMAFVTERAREISGPPLPGDIVLFHYGHCYAHGGIVTSWPNIVHALGPGRVSRVHVESSSFLRHLRRKYFSIWPRSGDAPVRA